MMKIEVELKGFTPLLDSLVEKYGVTRAAVFGAIWRYCQMKKGVCDAGLDKIAGRIGVSTRTIIRHAQELCEDGYLEDLTPDLKNKPHTYRDTGKATLEGIIKAKDAVTQSHSTNVQGDRESQQDDRESQHAMTESHKKKQQEETKEETTTTGPDDFGEFDRHPDYQDLVNFYQKQVLQSVTISSVIANDLDDILTGKIDKLNNKPVAIELVIDACKEMIRANKRDMRYLIGILSNWQQNGGKPQQSGTNGKIIQNTDGSYYL